MKLKLPYIIRLKGGLGNQLFQYAYGIKMEKKFGLTVLFDARGLRNASSPREFELSDFKFLSEHKRKFIFEANSNFIGKLISSIYSKLGRLYKESDEMSRPGIYSGFWQSTKYLEFLDLGGVKDIEFNESFVNSFKISRKSNDVALHIRGTDFLVDKNCKNLGWDFYEKALSFFDSGLNNLSITIFTDDPVYVKNLVPKEIRYYLTDSKSAGQDLLRLSQFPNLILANSTFSLWAAYLSQSSDGKVIVPGLDYFYLKGEIFKSNWLVVD